MRVWTAHEAAAFLLGYEPWYAHYFYSDPPFGGDNDEPEDVNRTAIAVEARRLEKILESAQLAGELGKVELNQVGKPWGKPVTWQKWVSWAKSNNIECAEELLAAVSELDEQKDTDEEVLHPRLKASLYLIIGALLQELKENTGDSQAKIIEQIVDLHVLKSGLSKSNLEYHFAEANRYLNTW